MNQSDIDRLNTMMFQLKHHENKYLASRTNAAKSFHERKGKALMVRIHLFAESLGMDCPFCPSSEHVTFH